MRGLSPFYIPKMPSGCSSCISCRFQPLSTTYGQIAHVLLTRSPLGHLEQALLDLVRLACIRHAASVHPEPGSNSPLFVCLFFSTLSFPASFLSLSGPRSVLLELTFPVWFSKIGLTAFRCVLSYIITSSLLCQCFFLLFVNFVELQNSTQGIYCNKSGKEICPLVLR